jgi:hypothetical protein
MILEIAFGIVGALFLLALLPSILEALGGLAIWVLGLGLVYGVGYGLWLFGTSFVASEDFRVGTAWWALVGLVVIIYLKIRWDKATHFKSSLGLKRWLIWMRPALNTASKMKKIKRLRAIDLEQDDHRIRVLEYAHIHGRELADSVAAKLKESLKFFINNHIIEVSKNDVGGEINPKITIARYNSRIDIAVIEVVISPATTNSAIYHFNFKEGEYAGKEHSFSSNNKLFKKSKKCVERYVANNPMVLDGICAEEVRRIEPEL